VNRQLRSRLFALLHAALFFVPPSSHPPGTKMSLFFVFQQTMIGCSRQRVAVIFFSLENQTL